MFSLVALIVLPWTLAFLRVPNLLAVYSSVRISDFAVPFLFGAGWGVAQVLFGLAVLRVGMALSFATTIGLGAALGTLVPILLRHPAVLKSARGEILLLGVLLMVAGVIVCSWAGRRREREKRSEPSAVGERSYMIGILWPQQRVARANAQLFTGIWRRFPPGSSSPSCHTTGCPYAVWPMRSPGVDPTALLAGSCTATKAGAISSPFGHRS